MKSLQILFYFLFACMRARMHADSTSLFAQPLILEPDKEQLRFLISVLIYGVILECLGDIQGKSVSIVVMRTSH